MDQENRAPLPNLDAYIADDPPLAAAIQHFQSVSAGMKARRAHWTPEIFTAVLEQVNPFIFEAPQAFVGRALICGVAVHGDLMLIINESLQKLLGISARSIHFHLNHLGWVRRTATDIGFEAACDAFGKQIFTEALRFGRSIHFRIHQPPQMFGCSNPLIPPPASALGDAIVDEVLAHTECPEDHVELDQAMMVHVLEASTEEIEDSSENEDTPAEVTEEVGSEPDLGGGDAPPCARNPLQDQVSELKRKLVAKTRAFVAQKMKLARACRVINRQRGEIERLASELQEAYRSMSPDVPAEGSSTAEEADVRRQILSELVARQAEDPNRRRYSDTLKEFAYVLHALSPKAHAFVRQALPLPSVATIVTHAEEETMRITRALGGPDGVPIGPSLSEYLQQYRHTEEIPDGNICRCTLSFDATSATATGIKGRWSQSGSCFAFLMLPLDHRYPDLLIRSVYHKTGKIDAAIREIRNALVRVLEQNGFVCHFVATDGDSGVDGRHQEAYLRYAGWGEINLEAIAVRLTNDWTEDLNQWPISDLLHLMKNARSRLALGSLAFNAETRSVINAKWIASKLEPTCANAFEARKPLDLLKDDLAIRAFTLENILTLWRQGDVAGAYFLYPFVTLSLAVRNPTLSAETRLHLIQASFSVFLRMCEHYPACGADFHISEKTVSSCDRKTFWTKSMCRRACNTCVGLYWAIRMSQRPENDGLEAALNRIGSHSVECHFGMTRSTLNCDTRWERFFSAQVTAVLIQKVIRKLGFHLYIRRLAMPAGCIVLPDTRKSIRVEMGDIIERIENVSLQMSACRDGEALADGSSFMVPLFILKQQLDSSGWVEPIPESGRLSGGGIKNRLFSGRVGGEPPIAPTADESFTLETFADG